MLHPLKQRGLQTALLPSAALVAATHVIDVTVGVKLYTFKS